MRTLSLVPRKSRRLSMAVNKLSILLDIHSKSDLFYFITLFIIVLGILYYPLIPVAGVTLYYARKNAKLEGHEEY